MKISTFVYVPLLTTCTLVCATPSPSSQSTQLSMPTTQLAGQSLTDPIKPILEPLKPVIDPLKQKEAPIIESINRPSGAPGIVIQIYGKSLNPPGIIRPKVIFESGLRSVLNPITISDSKIEVRVPEGRGVKNVSVETASGVSNKLKVTLSFSDPQGHSSPTREP